MSEKTQYILNGIPPDIRKAILERAQEQDVSVASVVAATLCARYSIPFTPSGRHLRPEYQSTPQINLRLPALTVKAVRAEADQRHLTMRSVMLVGLAEAFGLPAPAVNSVDPASRGGRPKAKK